MNRNEAIKFLRKQPLQSRIEKLLDMKFETEEKLLETIGSLWGKAEPVKTYWDGIEPIRVGHVVAGGEVVAVAKPEYCVFTDDGLEIWETTAFQPHPFAKFTEQEREFLQSQIEAGVIKLC